MSGTYQKLPGDPQQSARYEDPAGDTPNYRGYTNPDLQSTSFKRIQEKLDKEEEAEADLPEAEADPSMHAVLFAFFINISNHYINL
jgi:hypothetical protein